MIMYSTNWWNDQIVTSFGLGPTIVDFLTED